MKESKREIYEVVRERIRYERQHKKMGGSPYDYVDADEIATTIAEAMLDVNEICNIIAKITVRPTNDEIDKCAKSIHDKLLSNLRKGKK